MNNHAADKCAYQVRLPDLADDLLSGPDRREVEAHLRTCASCRGELELLRQSLTLARSVWQEDWDRYVRSASAPVVSEPGRDFRARLRFGAKTRTAWGRLAAAAAAVVLAAALGLLWHSAKAPHDGGISTPPQMATASDVGREDMAARLLASAEMMGQYPGLQEQARQSRRYVWEHYGDTKVARESSNAVMH